MKYLLVLFFIPLNTSVFAQDIHFSQFYASPLTLNPALTGVNEGNFRANVIYRNQWNSVTVPYSTPGISFDINHVLFKANQKGFLSVGVELSSDVSGTGNFSALLAAASVAYSFQISDNSFLSVGIQPGFVQKRFDANELTFEEQFDGASYNGSQSNGENFTTTGISYFDINAGIFLTEHISDNFDWYAGVAEFHLTQPTESFYDITINSDGTDNQLPMKTALHGGMRIGLNDKWDLLPSAIFLLQGKNEEFNGGLTAENKINDDTHIFFGSYYRLNDAVIPVFGAEYKKVRLGLSYDVNISSLNAASASRGGFEIGLQYTSMSEKRKGRLLYCPRF